MKPTPRQSTFGLACAGACAATLVGILSGCATETSSPARAVEPSTWSVDSLLHSDATPTWEEAVRACERLASRDSRASFHRIGTSDVGRPIHALVLSNRPANSRRGGNPLGEEGVEGVRARLDLGRQPSLAERPLRLLINNAVHPGEPCGVNASLALAQKWLSAADDGANPLAHLDVVIVPHYNVGGASRRNCCTRANQNGPEAYGFRGNGANLDLNRDFVKMDSRNAEAFVALMHAVDPDVFVDTHTSNGADYPYTMTLITTQPDKAGPVLGPFLRDTITPALMAAMAAKGWPMVPYVFGRGDSPREGIVQFLETPRYSTGFTTLWGTLGFTTEAHMLKPFADRVQATFAFLEVLAEWGVAHREDIAQMRERERARVASSTWLPVRWEVDSTAWDSVWFEGYTARYEWSAVTGGRRLRYDHDAGWSQFIRYDNRYVATDSVRIPSAWVVPQAWRGALARLKANQVRMVPLARDTVMLVEAVFVESFESSSRPYEGHHPIAFERLRSEWVPVNFYAGDMVIPSDQPARRYLAEVLSPRAHDALAVWNFFDAALQRKEYYSGYVFEDTAEELLREDSALRAAYEEAVRTHPSWKDQPGAALRWIYEHSPFDEGTAYRLPVYQLP